MFRSKERNGGKHRVALGRVESSNDLHADRSMGDRIQSTKGRSVVKDDLGDEGAVERSIRIEDGTAERVDQRRERRACRRRHVVGDVIGVYDRETQFS